MQKKKQCRVLLNGDQQKQNGITLIALIITIIVMLILVAVSVNVAMDSGLFGHAQDATNKWANAQRSELEQIQELLDTLQTNEKLVIIKCMYGTELLKSDNVVIKGDEYDPNEDTSFTMQIKDVNYIRTEELSSVTLEDIETTIVINYDRDMLVDPAMPIDSSDSNYTGDYIPDSWQVEVEFFAVNGTTSFEHTVVTKVDDSGYPEPSGTATLTAAHIPTTSPFAGYGSGAWNRVPTVGLRVSSGDSFGITYVRNQYTVTYAVTGDVPTGYTAPAACTVNGGQTHEVASSPASQTGTYNGASGTFTFSGWSRTGTITISGNTLITGVWTFTANAEPETPVPPDAPVTP